MPASLGPDSIESMLRHIGLRLSRPRTLILFGGCAMAIQRLKSATIDVDAILVPSHDYAELIRDLKSGGFFYNKNEAMDAVEPQDLRPRLHAMEMWFGPHGWRIDLFPSDGIWHRGLRFSHAMEERTRPWFTAPNLQARLADPSSIFLLKSITGRWRNQPGRDLDDLRRLHASGRIEWDFIQEEWLDQKSQGLAATAIARAQEAVSHLRTDGLHIPWDP